ncbi:MAG: hypothetical protein QNJ64_19410 [Crocosphaera sp.]|nr:hypothetical protein [Crocosphaera sp.]
MNGVQTAKEDISSNSNFWQKLFTGWDWQKVVLTIFTTVIASGLGFWQFQLQRQLDEQQFQLTNQVEQDKLVGQMLQRVDKYLTMSKLEDEEKAIILISLTKIVTDAHLEDNQGINTKEQQELLRGIPFYVALLSENDDALVTIGSKNDKDVSLWVKFAKQTSNTDIKITAAKALEKIFYLSEDGENDINRAKIINYLLALTTDWQNQGQNQEFNNKLQTIMNNMLKDFPPEESEGNDQLKEALLNARAKYDELKVAKLSTPEEIGQESGQEKQTDQVKVPQIIQQIPDTLSQKSDTLSQDEKNEISTLINNLKNNHTATRRSARSKLGALGQKAVPQLLSALENENNIYRIRLGVVTALLLMEQPVEIPPENIDQITELLGDNDITIRTTTANLLIELSAPKTQENVVNSLSENLKDLQNDDKVYNSVVVLGELKPKVSASLRKTIEESLTKTKQNLSKNESAWTNTIRQINKYL